MTREEDLRMARDIACGVNRDASDAWRQYCREGAYDTNDEVQGALFGILIGRGMPRLSDDELVDLFSDAMQNVQEDATTLNDFARACVGALRKAAAELPIY